MNKNNCETAPSCSMKLEIKERERARSNKIWRRSGVSMRHYWDDPAQEEWFKTQRRPRKRKSEMNPKFSVGQKWSMNHLAWRLQGSRFVERFLLPGWNCRNLLETRVFILVDVSFTIAGLNVRQSKIQTTYFYLEFILRKLTPSISTYKIIIVRS